ncbi:MAG: hypothetical protein PUP93_29455 [Rhizonema sp. NSF051]|nr:hypothetical protein [Rhizonema sp. NSF051]
MPQFLVRGQVRLKNGVCKLPMAIATRLSTSENDFDNARVCVGGLYTDKARLTPICFRRSPASKICFQPGFWLYFYTMFG